MGKSKQPPQPTSPPLPPPPEYRMRISRLTVDKLGIKLYDRVSAVIAELVANSYDADATKVTISAPMDELLAEKYAGKLMDKGYKIEVTDNGHGMTPEEVNEFYLVVGAERRSDSRRGDKSKKFKRKVMGRKGVGKLAPLGICGQIEVITSGGELIQRDDSKGYLTAHFTLVRSAMMQDSDEPYTPPPGDLNGTLRPSRGTTIRMSKFDHRRVPKIEDFDRQLAQRFGVKTPNWELVLRDSQKTPSAKGATRTVGEVDFEMKEGTKIEFREITDDDGKSFDPPRYGAFTEDGEESDSVSATFEYEGREYPVLGWMGYSKHPYRDDLMAGVRIYCRGKFAAQTNIFNMKAGFTGEYDVRSYLVGVLNADWLDEEEDLILTSRSDILWSDPLGQAFEDWGQRVVRHIGSLTREPMRKAAWDTFREKTRIETKVEQEFPGEYQEELREKTLDIAKTIVKSARPEELEDKKYCSALVDLALLLGPHITLEQKLIEASEDGGHTLEAVNNILRVARVAELASFGRIADDRVKVIGKVEELKNADADEREFQSLIAQTPWLLNPQWSPIVNNESLTKLKTKFMEFFKRHTGESISIYIGPPGEIVLTWQFVMMTQESSVEIIEIKKPGQKLQNSDMDRIATYHDAMDAFFRENEGKDVLRGFEKFHITLVCDEVSLRGAQKIAFEGMKESGGLTQVSWPVFLKRTRKMHEAFLTEAERQKKNAGKK
jgi:hypothetical protein